MHLLKLYIYICCMAGLGVRIVVISYYTYLFRLNTGRFIRPLPKLKETVYILKITGYAAN